MQELHAIVSGRVQMVMMRDFVQRSASKLGLKGYVKNLSDGTVEVVAQGEQAPLEQLFQKLHTGSVFARVHSVKATWRDPSVQYRGFIIDYSR